MIHNQFKGLGVAVVTPFNADLKIDYKSLEKVVNHLIRGNANYLVVMGTTGESVTLSAEEKQAVVEFIAVVNTGRLPIVYGLGGHNTGQLLSEMESMNWEHIDALLSVSPYYNKPTQEGIVAHYRALDKYTKRPIILYNVPGRTASNMLPSTTLELAKSCKNIIGIKEASGNLEQCMAIIDEKPNDFLVISGDDALVLPFMACGGDGVISVVGNAFPQEFSEMVNATLEDDFTHARSIHYRLVNIIHQLFAEGNPAGVKQALKFMNIADNHVRLPLMPMSHSGSNKLRELINNSGLTRV